MQLGQKQIIIKAILDKIVNLTQAKYDEILNEMINTPITSTNRRDLRKIITSKLKLRSLGKNSKEYWVTRGWPDDIAYVRAKENSHRSVSVYSREFWLKKINPNTNTFYSIEEADFERNSRRPIRKEYWMKKGYNEEDAAKLAIDIKINNNKKGASSQNSAIRRVTSKRCIEYYLARGFSQEESNQMLAEHQTFFSKQICIDKYGFDEGMKIWQNRQIKWNNSLKKSGMYLGISQISVKLFDRISETVYNLKYGKEEVCIKSQFRLYSVDCLNETNNRIIEFYGDYWHANPNKFTEDMILKKRLVKNIWENDAQRISELNELGYKVLIVWESEVTRNFEETVKKCIQHLIQ